MKRISLLLHSFALLLLLIISSCGSDNNSKGASTATAGTSPLKAECSCIVDSNSPPVCGVNTLTGQNQTYENACVASCYKATNVIQGNCDCSHGVMVCTEEEGTQSECDARGYRLTIKYYGTCKR